MAIVEINTKKGIHDLGNELSFTLRWKMDRSHPAIS